MSISNSEELFSSCEDTEDEWSNSSEDTEDEWMPESSGDTDEEDSESKETDSVSLRCEIPKELEAVSTEAQHPAQTLSEGKEIEKNAETKSSLRCEIPQEPEAVSTEAKDPAQTLSKGKEINKKAKSPRAPKICPVSTCRASVVNLPRHMRSKHKWVEARARAVVQTHKLRKDYQKGKKDSVEKSDNQSATSGKKVHKDYHKKRNCPLPQCFSVVKRLGPHLRKRHGLHPSSDEYKGKLSSAKVFVAEKESASARGESETDSVQELNQDSKGGSCDEDKKGDESDDSELEEGEQSAAAEGSDGPLEEFGRWLSSADGGLKESKVSKQHVAQVKLILSVIDKNGDILSLMKKKCIRDTFLKEYADKKLQPGTIKSYLNSLRHFCSYLLTDNPRDIKASIESVEKMQRRLGHWLKSYKKPTQQRHWQKMREDLDLLITPDKINEFEKSNAARNAISLLGQLSAAHSIVITLNQFTLVRDFLITELVINNAQRSGVPANMTLKDFQSPQISQGEKGDNYVVSISKHKTSNVFGPAHICLSSVLYNWIKIYISEVRSQLRGVTNTGNAKVFLTWNGADMTSSQITSAMKSVWKKAGMDGRVSGTLVRKSAVSIVHDQHKELTSNLALHMTHGEVTAKKYYSLQDSTKKCAQTGERLYSIMRASTSGNGKEKESSAEVQPPPSKTESPSKRISWSDEQRKAIQEMFAEEIKNHSITMENVRERIQCVEVLKGIEPKKVYDRVRSEWRFRVEDPVEQGMDPQSLPEEGRADRVDQWIRNEVEMSGEGEEEDIGERSSSNDCVPPTTSSTSCGSRIFSDADIKILLTVCGSMLKRENPISKSEIEKRLKGHELLAKFTVAQIVARLKYERKLQRK